MNVLADLPRRTKLIALLGLTSVVLGGGALSIGPVIRARAVATAAKRGVELDVGQVRLGWGAIWLKDVALRAPKMPGVSGHLTAVRVALGVRLDVSDVGVHGAEIELQGDAAELRRQWDDFRAQGAPPKNEGGAAAHYSADGVNIAWRVRAGEEPQRAWAVSYERSGDREQVELGSAQIHDAGLELAVRQLRAVLRRAALPADGTATPRTLESLTAEGLELGWTQPDAAPPASAPVPTGKPSERREHHFQADPLRGGKLRAGLAEVAAFAARSLPDGSAVNIAGVSVHFRRGGDTLNFGPSALRVAHVATQIDFSLTPSAETEGTPLELRASLPIAGGDVHAELRGGPVSLRSLGVRDGDFGLRDVQSATIQATGDVTLAADGSRLAFSGNGALDRVALQRAELSALPLGGIHAAFRGRGSTTLDFGDVRVEDSELSFGDVRIEGRGTIVRAEKTVQLHGSGGVPLASCQAFLDATPSGLTPLIAGLRMSGTFAVQAAVDYDSEHASDTRVKLNVANDCHIERVPQELSPRRFATVWRREVKGADKQPMEVESGPGSPDWVPYEAISRNMEIAVQVCEDGHFMTHHGFDFEAIGNSIRDDLIKGRFVRGASTVSMQLAKNLYLGKEKTLGRKLQEAVLTQLLEQELSKQELMELYLNVIEYGPGVYGIGPAARYYFAERPSDLSLAQALYIASIFPNPERQHFDKDGRVNEAWMRYLHRLMYIAKKVGRISAEELETGLSQQVAFHVADAGAAAAPNPYPQEGTDTPSELSP